MNGSMSANKAACCCPAGPVLGLLGDLGHHLLTWLGGPLGGIAAQPASPALSVALPLVPVLGLSLLGKK